MAHLTFTYGINKINFVFPRISFIVMNTSSARRTASPASHAFALAVSGQPIVHVEQKLTPFHRDTLDAGIDPGQLIISLFYWRFMVMIWYSML